MNPFARSDLEANLPEGTPFAARWPREPTAADAFRMGGLAAMDQYSEASPAQVFGAYDKARAERDKRIAEEAPWRAKLPAALRNIDFEPAGAADRLISDAVIPKTPLDAGLMVAAGPVGGKALRVGAGAMGALFDPDEAQAKGKGLVNAVRSAGRAAPAPVENWLPVTPTPFVGAGAQRVYSPGIYRDPRVIAAEANARVAPEHPAMKKLFGVTRDDLYEISQQGRREGNITDPGLFAPAKPGGSYAAEAVMNPANAQRLIDSLTEAKKFPDLVRGMIPWYVMDPAFQQMVKLVGRERAVAEYTKFNSMMTPFSASSDVMKEINRGTAARMMAEQNRFPDFVKYGGMPVEKRGADFPPEMAGVIPHLRHAPTHTDPVTKYLATGSHGYGQDTVKIPLYTQASGVPETGFQTRFAVPDAHFTRASGMSDVRRNAGPGDYMVGSEYRTFSPWFRKNVAEPVSLEAVPTQALMWGTFSPQTGVKTPIGAPKLELLSQRVWERAHDLGIDPKKLRDQVLMGKEYASWLVGAPFGAAMMGSLAAQDEYR